MEISRHIQSIFSASAEAPTAGKNDAAVQAVSQLKAAGSATSTSSEKKQQTEPRLEELQEAIRALPEIDMEQVATIKKAIARGELSVDVKVLAHSLLAYHRGSDV